MRRLPIYFLIDVSESMVGEPIMQVENGIRTIIQELRTDPYALETVFVSIIAFAGKARCISPLTELTQFYPPAFPIGSGTSLGNALRCLMHEIDTSVHKTTREAKGDWKPIVFLFTDGTPTDNPEPVIELWNAKYRRQCTLVTISLGDNADTHLLGQMTETVLRLNDTGQDSYKQFFKWISASIQTTSVSVCDRGQDGVQLAPLDGINLEKIDPEAPCKVDENFAVLLAKCSETKRLYLIKFAKRMRCALDSDRSGHLLVDESTFKLMGAYPIDEAQYAKFSEEGGSRHQISSDILAGMPVCPCCGNQPGMVLCSCGKIFCAEAGNTSHCPWCGIAGVLQAVSDSIDFSRERG